MTFEGYIEVFAFNFIGNPADCVFGTFRQHATWPGMPLWRRLLLYRLLKGEAIALGLSPNGMAFRISGPNGNSKALYTSDLVLENLNLADSGTYVFSTAEECELQFLLNMENGPDPLGPGDIDSIVIYRNPLPDDGKLNLHLKEFMGVELNAAVYDIKGRNIYQRMLSADHKEEETLDLSALRDGVYLLNIQVIPTGDSKIHKVVKIR